MADNKYVEEIEVLITSNAEEVNEKLTDLTEKTVIYRGAIIDVKKEQEELNKAFQRGDITIEQFSAGTAVLDKSLDQLQTELKKTEADIKLLNKASLQDIWNGMVDGVKHAHSLKDAFGVVKTAFSAFTKTLMANPFVAIGTLVGVVLVGAFKELKKAFERNSEAMGGMKRLFEMLQIPMRLVQKLFDKLATAIGVAANKIADFVKKFANFLGIEVTESTKAMKELDAAERDYAERSAARQAQIAEKRNKASELRRVDAKKSEELLKEVLELEKEGYEDEISMINRRIKAEQERQKAQNDNSKKAKKRLSDLKTQLSEAEAKYQNAARAINRSLNTVRATTQKIADDTEESTEKSIKALEDQRKEIQKYNDQNVKSNDKANAEILRVHKENIKSQIAALKEAGNEISGESKKNFEAALTFLENLIGITDKAEDYSNKRLEAENKINEAYDKQLEINKEIADLDEKMSSYKGEELEAAQKLRVELLKGKKVATDTYNTNLTLVKAYDEEINKLKSDTEALVADFSNVLSKVDANLGAGINRLMDRFRYSVKSFDEERQSALDAFENSVQREADSITKAYNAQVNALKIALNEDRITEEQFRSFSRDAYASYYKNITDLHIQSEKKRTEITEYYATQRREEELQAGLQAANAVANLSGAMADVYKQNINAMIAALDEKKEKEQEVSEAEKQAVKDQIKQQLAWTLAQIWLAQAQAFAQAAIAFVKALNDPTIPSTIARIALAVTTAATAAAGIISAITQTNQAMQQAEQQAATIDKYATGGYIQGAGTATSDSIPARLSNGEAVINARSTARFYDLLSAINQAGGGVAFPDANSVPQLNYNFAKGGVAYESMYNAMHDMVANIQPIVSVKEITKVQNRLKAKEII